MNLAQHWILYLKVLSFYLEFECKWIVLKMKVVREQYMFKRGAL